jgi:hypothetical protein
MGAVTWGFFANVPFPTSAHRTVRADLPHTALRLASPKGTRRGIQRQAFETQEAHFVDGLAREPPGPASRHLMPDSPLSLAAPSSSLSTLPL